LSFLGGELGVGYGLMHLPTSQALRAFGGRVGLTNILY
jgi:hypothetical protein